MNQRETVYSIPKPAVDGFVTGREADGRAFEHTFKKAGSYRLFCSLPPVGMIGSVKVVGRSRSTRR